MSDVRSATPNSVSSAGELGAERLPANTPKSYLTLSVAPEFQPIYSGALAVERLDRILRAERDPITPELLREKLGRGGGHVGGLARRLHSARQARAHAETEAELRELWGK